MAGTVIGYPSMDAARIAQGVVAGSGMNAATGAVFGLDPVSLALSVLTNLAINKFSSTPSYNAGFTTAYDTAFDDDPERWITLDPFASGLQPYGYRRRTEPDDAIATTAPFRELDNALYELFGGAVDFSTSNPFVGFGKEGEASGTFWGTSAEKGKGTKSTPIDEQLLRFGNQWLAGAGVAPQDLQGAKGARTLEEFLRMAAIIANRDPNKPQEWAYQLPNGNWVVDGIEVETGNPVIRGSDAGTPGFAGNPTYPTGTAGGGGGGGGGGGATACGRSPQLTPDVLLVRIGAGL